MLRTTPKRSVSLWIKHADTQTGSLVAVDLLIGRRLEQVDDRGGKDYTRPKELGEVKDGSGDVSAEDADPL